MDSAAQELIARLRRNPEDAEAFGALRAHYQRIGDYASLANLLEGWAGRARDPSAAAQALFEAGELVLGVLADRERAIRMYERALATEPRHQDAFLRLRALFEDAEDARRLADLLERQGAALSKLGADARDVALLYHQLGELWEHRFARVDRAVHHYRRAFELDPGLVPAIYAAREIYRQAGNIKAAAGLLEKEAKAELDPARRVALWRELAHVRAEQLDDPEGAAIALKRALEVAPGDLEVMHDLARVYLARASRGKDEHVAASDRHRAADLFYQIAQKVPPEHALPYLEGALDARPDHEGALALLERVADDLGQGHRLPARWVAYLAHAPERPEAAYRRKRLAEAYLEAGQIEYAITCLEWLLEDGDAEAAERLVDLYRAEGREEDALRALGIAALGLPPSDRIPRLRELVAALRDRGDLEGAASYAREILAIDPADPEAITLIEDACRHGGDYLPLREALLAASRVSGLSTEARKQRLKEVAVLSEHKIGDLDGAIGAWRGVIALDPSEREARNHLKRLLRATERWDELVDVLERETLTATDPEPKAEIYRQLARVHREHRGDLQAAIRALRNLRELLPDDTAGRDALCDALLEAGATLEAIPLLRQRVDSQRGPERARSLRLLATVLEEHVGDEEGAFDAWARLLDENPADLDAIAHMEAIDRAAGRFERLLSTLSYRVEVSPPEERAAILAHMGDIAASSLDDLDRAAELYGRALELSPGDPGILDALCRVYDRAERYKDLVVLLRDTANAERDPRARAELYRRIARTLAERVGNDDGAAEAWREVLAAGEDEEALRFLRRHATRAGDAAALDEVLARLAAIVTSPVELRDILLERADLLADSLDRPAEALALLRRVVDELAPEHVVALGRLAAVAERVGDLAVVSEALFRQLALIEDAGLRLPAARRLADLHEKEAPDASLAIDALFAWSDADPVDPEPLARLVPLLESAGRWDELTAVLDALAGLVRDPAEASSLVRRSADVCYRQLGDVDGAWNRLEPRVREGDQAAEDALKELARGAGHGERLAELYVALAAKAEDPRRRWMDAARTYEDMLDDPARALEAVLRAFAVDLSDRSHLDEADRLAERAGAWPRLGQVYETLIKRSATHEEKVELLVRYARLLDERAGDPSGALDCTLRACSLAPLDDALLALAEERAPRAGRAEELLVTYDKRRMRAGDDAARVEALSRAARWCEITLGDRQRATHYLAQAVALTVRTPDLSAAVEACARELDERDGARGGMRRALVDILVRLAEDMEEDPVGGAALLLRAARILSEELASDGDALAVLERAATFAPSEAPVLDALTEHARRTGHLSRLDAHLATLVEEALDSRTAAELLRRRGHLLEELGRYEAAAEVWTRLSTVAGGDAETRERLRAALRRAGQHQELLVALQRDVRRSNDPAERIALMKEIASVWENELGNRWEALDAWKKVLKEAPGDREASDAVARLEHRRDAVSEDGPLSADEFADLTDPSEEQATPDDSSETVLDPSLYAQLREAQAAAEHDDAPAARETRRLDASEARSVEPPTRQLAPNEAASGERRREAEPETPPAPSAPLPGSQQIDDFDDDYTAVAEDVFQQLREFVNGVDLQPEPDAEEPAELRTGELELLDEPSDEIVQELDSLEEVDGLDEVEELDDVVEELDSGAIDELEEVEDVAPPVRSGPPPPPRSRQ